ncbi:hypothetical protein FNV43_RR19220 [Rhamnella rubrinervis]|uniref:Uncharacterized protein n=1 Tax=Rhamnella rubrinervis TaxID=2594499 RepID=A0A8K0GWA9_9ROSA|nr:hypothetical protein FNV43_RR19220 [Rhamnella rubrinervis]
MRILVELHEKRFDSLEKELGIHRGYLDTSNGHSVTAGTNKAASNSTSLNTRKLDEETENLAFSDMFNPKWTVDSFSIGCSSTVAFNPMFDPFLEASREATNTGVKDVL